MLLPAISALVALAAMLPGPEARYAAPYDGSAPLQRFSGTLIGLWQAMLPIPAAVNQWWNSSLLSLDAESARHTPGLLHGLAAVALGSAIGIAWLFRRQPLALTFLLASWLLIFAFSFTQFAGTMRHLGHYFLAVLGAWWIASRPVNTEPPRLMRRRDVVLSGLLGLQAIGGLVASYRDLTQPFTAAPAVATWIRDHGRGLRLIGNPDYAAVPVAAELGQPFFSPQSFDFVTWNTQGPPSPQMPASPDEPNLLAAILRKTGEREMLLIRNQLTLAPLGQPVAFDVAAPGEPPAQLLMTPIALFPDSAVDSEQYTLLHVRLDAAEAARP